MEEPGPHARKVRGDDGFRVGGGGGKGGERGSPAREVAAAPRGGRKAVAPSSPTLRYLMGASLPPKQGCGTCCGSAPPAAGGAFSFA